MSGSRAAVRYAKAILNYALEQKNEVQVNNDMLFISRTIEESSDLQLMIGSPVLKTELKLQALKSLFSSKINDTSFKLIELLIANKRIAILNDVAKKFTVLFDELKGIEVAHVTTAIPLSEELNKQVLSKIKSLTGKEAEIKNTVNPEIIGGFILRIGDIQYDSSISSKLKKVKKQLKSESVSL